MGLDWLSRMECLNGMSIRSWVRKVNQVKILVIHWLNSVVVHRTVVVSLSVNPYLYLDLRLATSTCYVNRLFCSGAFRPTFAASTSPRGSQNTCRGSFFSFLLLFPHSFLSFSLSTFFRPSLAPLSRPFHTFAVKWPLKSRQGVWRVL